jgi:hypothetical protein
MKRTLILGVAALAIMAPIAGVAAQAPAAASSEDTRLTAFLNAQFAEEIAQKP